MSTNKFILHSDYTPEGDQLEAIAKLISGVENGVTHQTLKGITGSGKTFTMANVIHRLKRPTLVLAPNKTLTAQLYDEMKRFFPENAVEYFVSYYDYFQPEVYIPGTSRFIKKDSAINEHLERARLATTKALIERKDVIVVASVSSIYGLGHPDDYRALQVSLFLGLRITQKELIAKLLLLQYEQVESKLKRATFRVEDNKVKIFPADSEFDCISVTLNQEIIESLDWFEPQSGKKIKSVDSYTVSPKTLFASSQNRVEKAVSQIKEDMEERVAQLTQENRLVEAERLFERVSSDIEMMEEKGYCSGIENYASYLNGTGSQPPTTLLDYLPKDGLLFIDESHVMLPQISAMYRSDQSRKDVLIDFGFRLPSAKNNRPLNFQEFEKIKPQAIFVSATPGDYEIQKSNGHIIEQIIRPTGLLDPEIEIRSKVNYLEDLCAEIEQIVEKKERVLVTTLTKASAEELNETLVNKGLRSKYMHSDLKVEQRTELIKQLREGAYDTLIGISLLREGLDIPEASMIAILNADKAGFLRSSSALIQMIGRVARHENGKAILYADQITPAMQNAINETKERRQKQISYNDKHGIKAVSSVRKIADTNKGSQDSFKHSVEFCESLTVLCDLITKKEQLLLETENSGLIETTKRELKQLYQQFIYM